MRPRSFVTALTIALVACGGRSPEAQVKATFEACVAAVEAGDAPKALEHLSPRFEGPDGMDAGSAKLYLWGVLRRGKVGVTVLAHRVEVRGPEAYQTVDLLLTERGEGRILPQDGSRRRFVLRWERRDRAWKLRELRSLDEGR